MEGMIIVSFPLSLDIYIKLSMEYYYEEISKSND